MRSTYIYDNISLNPSQNEKFSKVVGERKMHISCFIMFFRKYIVYKIMWGKKWESQSRTKVTTIKHGAE